MAKERLITRTISHLEVELTLYDKASKNTATTHVQVPKFKTNKELEKYLDSHYNDGSIRWVEINSITEHNDIYAISETDFLKYGFKVEKNTNKED